MGATIVKLQSQPISCDAAERDREYLLFLVKHYANLKEGFNNLPREDQAEYIVELNTSYDGLGDAFASHEQSDFECKVPQSTECGAVLEKLVQLKVVEITGSPRNFLRGNMTFEF